MSKVSSILKIFANTTHHSYKAMPESNIINLAKSELSFNSNFQNAKFSIFNAPINNLLEQLFDQDTISLFNKTNAFFDEPYDTALGGHQHYQDAEIAF